MWKTWSTVAGIVDDIAMGYVALNLMPVGHSDSEQEYRFMGIYSKNREEWTFTDLATIRQSGTTVAFYDTLGPSAVEYVIKQTKVATISCESKYLKTLIKLKTQGKADPIKNLISFDHFEDEVRADAQAAGINLYHI